MGEPLSFCFGAVFLVLKWDFTVGVYSSPAATTTTRPTTTTPTTCKCDLGLLFPPLHARPNPGMKRGFLSFLPLCCWDVLCTILLRSICTTLIRAETTRLIIVDCMSYRRSLCSIKILLAVRGDQGSAYSAVKPLTLIQHVRWSSQRKRLLCLVYAGAGGVFKDKVIWVPGSWGWLCPPRSQHPC